ncbi:MAG: hypothetical protein JKX85_11250, partial [Phycisphaeraceae bacterium]|nr:hypothetical protein [Phycisphaeraceae bacterium]
RCAIDGSIEVIGEVQNDANSMIFAIISMEGDGTDVLLVGVTANQISPDDTVTSSISGGGIGENLANLTSITAVTDGDLLAINDDASGVLYRLSIDPTTGSLTAFTQVGAIIDQDGGGVLAISGLDSDTNDLLHTIGQISSALVPTTSVGGTLDDLTQDLIDQDYNIQSLSIDTETGYIFFVDANGSTYDLYLVTPNSDGSIGSVTLIGNLATTEGANTVPILGIRAMDNTTNDGAPNVSIYAIGTRADELATTISVGNLGDSYDVRGLTVDANDEIYIATRSNRGYQNTVTDHYILRSIDRDADTGNVQTVNQIGVISDGGNIVQNIFSLEAVASDNVPAGLTTGNLITIGLSRGRPVLPVQQVDGDLGDVFDITAITAINSESGLDAVGGEDTLYAVHNNGTSYDLFRIRQQDYQAPLPQNQVAADTGVSLTFTSVVALASDQSGRVLTVFDNVGGSITVWEVQIDIDTNQITSVTSLGTLTDGVNNIDGVTDVTRDLNGVLYFVGLPQDGGTTQQHLYSLDTTGVNPTTATTIGGLNAGGNVTATIKGISFGQINDFSGAPANTDIYFVIDTGAGDTLYTASALTPITLAASGTIVGSNNTTALALNQNGNLITVDVGGGTPQQLRMSLNSGYNPALAVIESVSDTTRPISTNLHGYAGSRSDNFDNQGRATQFYSLLDNLDGSFSLLVSGSEEAVTGFEQIGELRNTSGDPIYFVNSITRVPTDDTHVYVIGSADPTSGAPMSLYLVDITSGTAVSEWALSDGTTPLTDQVKGITIESDFYDYTGTNAASEPRMLAIVADPAGDILVEIAIPAIGTTPNPTITGFVTSIGSIGLTVSSLDARIEGTSTTLYALSGNVADAGRNIVRIDQTSGVGTPAGSVDSHLRGLTFTDSLDSDAMQPYALRGDATLTTNDQLYTWYFTQEFFQVDPTTAAATSVTELLLNDSELRYDRNNVQFRSITIDPTDGTIWAIMRVDTDGDGSIRNAEDIADSQLYDADDLEYLVQIDPSATQVQVNDSSNARNVIVIGLLSTDTTSLDASTSIRELDFTATGELVALNINSDGDTELIAINRDTPSSSQVILSEAVATVQNSAFITNANAADPIMGGGINDMHVTNGGLYDSYGGLLGLGSDILGRFFAVNNGVTDSTNSQSIVPNQDNNFVDVDGDGVADYQNVTGSFGTDLTNLVDITVTPLVTGGVNRTFAIADDAGGFQAVFEIIDA